MALGPGDASPGSMIAVAVRADAHCISVRQTAARRDPRRTDQPPTEGVALTGARVLGRPTWSRPVTVAGTLGHLPRVPASDCMRAHDTKIKVDVTPTRHLAPFSCIEGARNERKRLYGKFSRAISPQMFDSA